MTVTLPSPPTARDHLETAERLLATKAATTDERDLMDSRAETYLRAAEIAAELEKSQRPRPTEALLEELRPLLVAYLTPKPQEPYVPFSYVPPGHVICPHCLGHAIVDAETGLAVGPAPEVRPAPVAE